MIRPGLLAAAVAALLTVSATAADPARVREEVLPEKQLDLRALFERAPGVLLVDDRNGTTTGPGSIEVVVARIGPDGKLIKACVDSEAAARRFLEAPVETLQTKQAKEQ